VYPQLGSVPAYLVGWAVSSLLAGTAVVCLLRRDGVPWPRIVLFLGCGGALMFLGSKLLYLIEAWPAWWHARDPLDYVLSARMRIPGGFLLVLVAGPMLARVLGMPLLRFGDRLAPVAGLCIAGIRTGCFLRGCCYGRPAELPWAVTFPRYSEVFWWQVDQGLIRSTAEAPLPVHPLPIYFGLAGLALFAGLLWLQRRKRFDGEVLLALFAGYLWSTWALELLRAAPHTLTQRVVLVAALAASAVAATLAWNGRRLPVPEPAAPGAPPRSMLR